MSFSVSVVSLVLFSLACAFSISAQQNSEIIKRQNCTRYNPIQGPPGRDGVNGVPGVPGVPGESGRSLLLSEVQQIKISIQEELKKTLEKEILSKTQAQVTVLTTSKACKLGLTKHDPAMSCSQIYQCNPDATSKLYWLETKDNGFSAIREVYCDMERMHCGAKGWTRIGYINMTEAGASCPSPLRQVNSPVKGCYRADGSRASCSSVVFNNHGLKYSKICGQSAGYQKGSTDAFHGPRDINSYYVDGISITYGSPRKHVWTYAAGLSDDFNYNAHYNCPCAKYPGPSQPSFVGDHYYCESGNTGRYDLHTVHSNDPLWDGEGCGAGNSCCSQPGMPWFCRTLPQEVDEDIEMRLCQSEPFSNEEMYLELLEIFIQ